MITFHRLNCTKNDNCSESIENAGFVFNGLILCISIAIFGFITNHLRQLLVIYNKFTIKIISELIKLTYFSYYIFSECDKRKNEKFLDSIKVYTLNSYLFCTNDVITSIWWLIVTKDLYDEKNSRNYSYFDKNYWFVFYFTYIRSWFWSLFYTFGAVMDIYIAYSRVQVFKPNLTFLLKTPVSIKCNLQIWKQLFKRILNYRLKEYLFSYSLYL